MGKTLSPHCSVNFKYVLEAAFQTPYVAIMLQSVSALTLYNFNYFRFFYYFSRQRQKVSREIDNWSRNQKTVSSKARSLY